MAKYKERFVRCDAKFGEERCEGYMNSNGSWFDTCGEPCSFIMKKSGSGDPPFLSDTEVLDEIRQILLRQNWSK